MTSHEAIDRAADLLRAAKNVAVLTGAGVSAESGVPTFRASDGLWEGHKIEDVATPSGWKRDPRLVWKFYHARRANVATVKPNPGHFALAKLETHFGDGHFTLVTQNVDGLHRAAGSRNVLEVHGSLHRTRCLGCGEIKDQGLRDLAIPSAREKGSPGHMSGVPACEACGGVLRPDIVWFHENLPPDVWSAAELAAFDSDLFLVVGTSAVVYPAASLIPLAVGGGVKQPPAKVIEFNLTETDASRHADVGVYGPSGETLPKVLAAMGL